MCLLSFFPEGWQLTLFQIFYANEHPQHQGIDRPGVRQVPEGSGEQGKMEKTGCKIICGAQRPSRLRD